MIGRVIGTYKIDAKLGEGGMGAVFKGVDTMLDREVAIKALRPELASQTSIVERFRSEAVTLAKLNHPNIATLYSLIREGDELFMVLEYVRGETLEDIVRRRGRLTADEVIPAFCQVLDGIHHAHEVGIIHRDIKPANIVVMENGVPKVLDFGIARLLGSNRMTRAGNIIGTLEYMAPEQVKGLETDARSDIYALGMMLYEVLTGRTPFDTENEFELMKLQTETLPPAPRTIDESIDEAVEKAIVRAIQKDPGERFQSAGEFRQFLISAGYSADSATRKITGPKTAPAETIPIPHVTPLARPSHSNEVELKQTRLGTPSIAPLEDPGLKETRLGVPVGDLGFGGGGEIVNVPPAAAGGGLLSNLTWLHYSAAGVAVAVVLGVLILVPIVVFSGGFFSSPEVVPANSNSNSDRTTKIVATTPEPTPFVPATSTPVSRTEGPAPVTPIETPTPEPVSTPSQPPKADPAPPPRRSEPKKVTKPKQPSRKPSARCALTGDC